jgi:putative transposase
MGEFQKGSHSVYDIQYHIVWTTKYRYKILREKVAERLRELLKQGCTARDITIIRGSVGRDHVHMLISCPPTLAPSKIMQYLKGRSSKMLQEEFPELKKRYWGQHLWSAGYFCRTVGAVTDEMIKEYIEEQKDDKIDEVFKITE